MGDYKEQSQSFLVVDRKVVSEVPTEDVPLCLLAVFYVLNIRYTPGCTNFYTFMEVMLLKLKEPTIVVNPTVKNLLARLS